MDAALVPAQESLDAEAQQAAAADAAAAQAATEAAVGGPGIVHAIWGVVTAVDTQRHWLTLTRDDGGGTLTAHFGSMGLTDAEVQQRWVCLVAENGHQGMADIRWE